MSQRKRPSFPLQLDGLTPKAKVPGTRMSSQAAAETSRATGAPTGKSGAQARRGVGAGSAASSVVRPQGHLQPAAPATPSGLGLDSEQVRRRMVERLRESGIDDEAVLRAMQHIPRHRFVDSALANQAYEDTSLPIGLGQTISSPFVVARMIELMRQGRTSVPFGRVLEIGSGCGYQAAVLSCVAKLVVSIERLEALHEKARQNLQPLGLKNIRLVYGDGMLGYAPGAPYDGIISAACGDSIPPAWLEQLAPGGRLVAPVGGLWGQVLVVVENRDGNFIRSEHDPVRFVPLKSGSA